MADVPKYYIEYDFTMDKINNLEKLLKEIESISYIHYTIKRDNKKKPILLTLKLLSSAFSMHIVLIKLIDICTNGYTAKRNIELI